MFNLSSSTLDLYTLEESFYTMCPLLCFVDIFSSVNNVNIIVFAKSYSAGSCICVLPLNTLSGSLLTVKNKNMRKY